MQIQKPKQGYKIVKSLFDKYEEIPKEWEVTKQGDVCEFINGYAFSLKEFRENGYPIIRIQNLTGGKNFIYSDIDLPEKQFAKKGDLLFAWSGTFGPFIWNGPKASFHYHQWKVVPNSSTDKLFLYYHLDRISSTIKNMGQSGLGMFHMTKDGMEKFVFFKPPLQEQQKISSILLNVDSLLQQIKKEIEQTQKLKKGLMQKLLTKGIGHRKYKEVNLTPRVLHFNIPEEWTFQKLSKITAKITDGTHFTPTYVENGIPFLRVTDIQERHIDWKSVKRIPKDEHLELIKRCPPERGDILFSKNGTIGITKIIDWDEEFSCFVSLCLIKPDHKIIDSQFLDFVLSSEIIRKQITLRSKQLGVTNLHLEEIKEFDIPFPPIQEQREIASIISGISLHVYKQIEWKSNLENLKKGLMQKLLTGQLRVKI